MPWRVCPSDGSVLACPRAPHQGASAAGLHAGVRPNGGGARAGLPHGSEPKLRQHRCAWRGGGWQQAAAVALHGTPTSAPLVAVHAARCGLQRATTTSRQHQRRVLAGLAGQRSLAVGRCQRARAGGAGERARLGNPAAGGAAEWRAVQSVQRPRVRVDRPGRCRPPRQLVCCAAARVFCVWRRNRLWQLLCCLAAPRPTLCCVFAPPHPQHLWAGRAGVCDSARAAGGAAGDLPLHGRWGLMAAWCGSCAARRASLELKGVKEQCATTSHC